MSIVTFLFTDIEGSTRRWEADADAMRVALEAHNKVLRDCVEANDGTVFNYTGDGMCAVFASPRGAVDAAVDAQRQLQLPVRMGIATGEAELRGDDYFGTVLNRTARVMAAGHGGQILLDGATAELLTGITLIGLGSRRLRDIAKPVHLFQVQAPELRVDFPPLKTLDSTPGNLRVPTTSFHGREDEIAELQTALEAHRLVTLTGPGGVGKTRLALETAGRLAHEFPDGAFFIELASVTDPTAVPDAVAAILGVTQQPDMTITESVAMALRERTRLLIFDNCEHVLDAAADMIDAIRAQSTTVTILATSREGLRVDDEMLWPVASLEVQSGSQSAAAQLFVERAGVVSRDVPSLADDEAVIDICRRLDGIPLAIELAASRMMSMTVGEVRDRLDDRFRLLVGSRRGLERHQTLQHAVQWSYDLLDDSEKALLAKCSVFAGGFDLAAAVAVVGSTDEYATLDLLDKLVRKSLVTADRSTGHTRFAMLETIRQFAEARLIETFDAADARAAHARYYAAREDSVFALWDSRRQREAYEWLAAEMANLRTAFRWAVDHGDLDTAAAIAHYAGFVGFWSERHEPIRWSEELIERARAVEHPRLGQLYSVAVLCFTAGRIDEAVSYADAGMAAFLSGAYDIRPEVVASLGSPYAAIGDTARWVDWCRVVIARDPQVHLHTRCIYVLALTMSGLQNEAVAESNDFVAIADKTKNPNQAAWALFTFGAANRYTTPLAASDAFRRGFVIAGDSGNLQTQSSLAAMLTLFGANDSEPGDALDYSAMSIRYCHESGNFYLVKNTLAALTALLDRLGRTEAAAIISGFADNDFSGLSFPEFRASMAHLREVLGDEAYESLRRRGQVMSTAAMVAYALDQVDEARAALQQT